MESISDKIERAVNRIRSLGGCLLYTSDAADDLLCVDLGGRRIIKKKKKYDNPVDSYIKTTIT